MMSRRRWRRLVLSVIGGLVVLVTVAVLLLQIDDPLSPPANRLLAAAQPPIDSPAYVYLFGMNAPAGQDPSAVGTARIASYLAFDDTRVAFSAKVWDDPLTDTLPLLGLDPACSQDARPCNAEPWFDAAARRGKLTGEAERLARFRHFMTLGPVIAQVPPRLDAPLPPYQMLTQGARLDRLALFELGTQDADAAIRQLADRIGVWRGYLAAADEMVGKMIWVAILRESIDDLFVLGIAHNVAAPPDLHFLTANERALIAPMAREFIGSKIMYEELDRSPQLLSTDRTIRSWVARILFKPNMTLNRTAPSYQKVIDWDALDDAAFAAAIDTLDEPEPELESGSLRNRVGSVLASVATPSYAQYASRVRDLDVKIALYEAWRQQRESFPLTVVNPYRDQLESALDQGDGWSCLDGPLADNRRTRCLPTGVSATLH